MLAKLLMFSTMINPFVPWEKVKADVFAGKHGCKKAYGSYEELAADKKVELIYIATPHSEHFANAKMCMEYGKPTRCMYSGNLSGQYCSQKSWGQSSKDISPHPGALLRPAPGLLTGAHGQFMKIMDALRKEWGIVYPFEKTEGIMFSTMINPFVP